jgi:hypothetical protein
MDDWQPGDLALCIDDRAAEHLLRAGRIYTVLAVVADPGYDKAERFAYFSLIIKGIREHGGACNPHRFVKVTPPQADEFDRETVALLNGKPVPVEA